MSEAGFLGINFKQANFNSFNQTSTTTLKKYGKNKISSIRVIRKALKNRLINLLDNISFGQFKNLMKKFGYDKFFHLSLQIYIQMPDGSEKIIDVEKEQMVWVRSEFKIFEDMEIVNVPYSGQVDNIGDMLIKTVNNIGLEPFFRYSAFNYNCQKFIKDILESNNMYNKELDNFIYQSFDEMRKELNPLLLKGVNAVTDVANLIQTNLGYGKNENKCDCGGSQKSGYVRALIAQKYTKPKFNIDMINAPSEYIQKIIKRKQEVDQKSTKWKRTR